MAVKDVQNFTESREEVRRGLMLISVYEAALLLELRKFPFGQWTVHKNDGEPRRIIKGGSELLIPEEGEKAFEG